MKLTSYHNEFQCNYDTKCQCEQGLFYILYFISIISLVPWCVVVDLHFYSFYLLQRYHNYKFFNMRNFLWLEFDIQIISQLINVLIPSLLILLILFSITNNPITEQNEIMFESVIEFFTKWIICQNKSLLLLLESLKQMIREKLLTVIF